MRPCQAVDGCGVLADVRHSKGVKTYNWNRKVPRHALLWQYGGVKIPNYFAGPVDVAAAVSEHRDWMVAVRLLAEFDAVGFAILGDEVIKVIVNGFAG